MEKKGPGIVEILQNPQNESKLVVCFFPTGSIKIQSTVTNRFKALSKIPLFIAFGSDGFGYEAQRCNDFSTSIDPLVPYRTIDDI